MRSHPPRKSGFSLVEVTIGLGIMSFSLVALIGMLPVGMDTFRKSVETTVQAQIVQQLVNDLQQTRFDQIRNGQNSSVDYFFDDSGFKTDKSDWVFNAQLTIAPGDAEGTPLPAKDGSAANQNLRTATIAICRNAKVSDLRMRQSRELRIYTFVVADVGL